MSFWEGSTGGDIPSLPFQKIIIEEDAKKEEDSPHTLTANSLRPKMEKEGIEVDRRKLTKVLLSLCIYPDQKISKSLYQQVIDEYKKYKEPQKPWQNIQIFMSWKEFKWKEIWVRVD